MLHWLAYWAGLTDANSPPYLFFSGIGPCLMGLGIGTFAGGWLRHHNCHQRGCWRIARHQVAGTDWVVCAKHHPAGAPTAEHIADAHKDGA
jgi:hypothetical protein